MSKIPESFTIEYGNFVCELESGPKFLGVALGVDKDDLTKGLSIAVRFLGTFEEDTYIEPVSNCFGVGYLEYLDLREKAWANYENHRLPWTQRFKPETYKGIDPVADLHMDFFKEDPEIRRLFNWTLDNAFSELYESLVKHKCDVGLELDIRQRKKDELRLADFV